jgi:hypothetical protein
MATAPLKQNDVRTALEENEDAVTDLGDLTAPTALGAATVPTATASAPAAATSTAPTTLAAVAPVTGAATSLAPTTAATTVPPQGIRLLAIGDSVMLGAASPLRSMGFTVDAKESVQFDDVVPEVVSLIESGVVPDLVVVALGTNGTIDEDDAEQMFTALRSVPHVIALTVHVDKSWAPANNQLILSLPARFPNVTLLDWDGLASGCAEWAQKQGLPGNCFASDGFHLSADGADYYVELIRYTAVEQLGVSL